MKSLARSVDEFGFVERERGSDGEYVKNKCGRDFLYYVLNYYVPDAFDGNEINPVVIDEYKLFGKPMPANLAWTQIQFKDAPEFLSGYKLQLSINDKKIKSYYDFVNAILFSRKRLDQAFKDIESAVDANQACGIDVSLGLGGLLDHVVFVYGYDDENLYIIDTHNVPELEYELVDPKHPFLFKLSRKTIEARWTIFGRVWNVAFAS